MEAVPSGASFSSMQMVEALVDSSKKRSITVYQIHHIHRTLPMLGTSPGDTCGFLPLTENKQILVNLGSMGQAGDGNYNSVWYSYNVDTCDNWNPDP